MARDAANGHRSEPERARFRLPFVVSERVFVLVTLALYLVITAFVAFHHEVWSDESDPWLLMRDGGIGPLLEQTAYGHRGTPVVWFLMLWPLAASGLPLVAQQVLNLALAAGAVSIVLRWAPFPRWLRVLLVFSYLPAFEYSVIARPYASMMFFLFAAAALWRKREESPLLLGVTIALLAGTTVHGLIFAAVLGLLLLEAYAGRMNGRRAAALGVMLAGGLASVAQLWPRGQAQISVYRVELDTLWFSLADAVFPDARTGVALLPALAVILLTVAAIRTRHGQFFWWATATPIVAIFVFVWVAGPRHTGILLLALVTAFWISGGPRPDRWSRLAVIGLAVALAWSGYLAARSWRAETGAAFSGSREAAAYIAEHLVGTPIAAHRSMTASPILAYLPERRFWYPGRQAWGSYMTWDRSFQREQELPTREAVSRARAEFAGKEWALLLSTPLPAEVATGFRLVFETKETVWRRHDERYRIYLSVTPDEVARERAERTFRPAQQLAE